MENFANPYTIFCQARQPQLHVSGDEIPDVLVGNLSQTGVTIVSFFAGPTSIFLPTPVHVFQDPPYAYIF